MRKRIIAAVTLAALLVTAVGAALAAPGTTADPFVTLSYLTSTYYPQMEQEIQNRVEASTSAAEQAALDKLAQLTNNYMTQIGKNSFAPHFLPLTLARGAKLDLTTGSSILFDGGLFDFTFTSGTLVDVSTGSAITPGEQLTRGHRYVAAENTACSLVVTSDAAYLSVQGPYLLTGNGVPPTPFIDLQFSDPNYSYARFVYEKKLFQGTSATTFTPDGYISRAAIVILLHRMAGSPTGAPAANFYDVPATIYYADSINWAANLGIINGRPGNIFAPNDMISYEQLVVLLYRFAQEYMGKDVSAKGDVTVYDDYEAITPWTMDYYTWAAGINLMGENATLLTPTKTVGRMEIAVLLQNFIDLYPID